MKGLLCRARVGSGRVEVGSAQRGVVVCVGAGGVSPEQARGRILRPS